MYAINGLIFNGDLKKVNMATKSNILNNVYTYIELTHKSYDKIALQ